RRHLPFFRGRRGGSGGIKKSRQGAVQGGLRQANAGADQSVERRSSGALSDFEGSDLTSDLTGSILGLSSCGVSTRADTSTEPVRTGGRSERGRATARASSICAAP